jgi:hypothetical protein
MSRPHPPTRGEGTRGAQNQIVGLQPQSGGERADH